MYGITRLQTAKDCVTAGTERAVAAVFFHDVHQLCRWFDSSFSGEGEETTCWRENLIVVLDDVEAMWQLSQLHNFSSSLVRLLRELRATRGCALLTTAVSLTAIPEPILAAVGHFVSYPMPAVTESLSRLFLRTHAPLKCSDAEELTNTICRCANLSTTKASLLFTAGMVGGQCSHSGEKPKNQEHSEQCMQFIEGAATGGDLTQCVEQTLPPKQLFGLDPIYERLTMLLNVFIGHSDRSSLAHGGTLLSSMPCATGVLLHGPSGCGKSALLHRLSAAYPQIPFFFVRCTSLFSKYLGESEEKLREAYRKARSCVTSVVVLDNIDVISVSRGEFRAEGSDNGNSGGVNVSKRMLAVLLCELDGLTTNTNVLTIGVSNAPRVMDAAVLRQGRLETLLFVPPLTLEAAEMISSRFFRSLAGCCEQQAACSRLVSVAAQGCTPAELQFVLRKVLEECVLPCSPEGSGDGEWRLPAVEKVSEVLQTYAKSYLIPIEYQADIV